MRQNAYLSLSKVLMVYFFHSVKKKALYDIQDALLSLSLSKIKKIADVFQMHNSTGLRDVSMIKHTCCSCKRSTFSSKCDSQLLLPMDAMPFSVLWGLLHVCATVNALRHTCTCTYTQTCVYLRIKLIFSLQNSTDNYQGNTAFCSSTTCMYGLGSISFG